MSHKPCAQLIAKRPWQPTKPWEKYAQFVDEDQIQNHHKKETILLKIWIICASCEAPQYLFATTEMFIHYFEIAQPLLLPHPSIHFTVKKARLTEIDATKRNKPFPSTFYWWRCSQYSQNRIQRPHLAEIIFWSNHRRLACIVGTAYTAFTFVQLLYILFTIKFN